MNLLEETKADITDLKTPRIPATVLPAPASNYHYRNVYG